jgi:peptide chain release factor 2
VTVFDLPGLERRAGELTEKTLEEGFWDSGGSLDISRELVSAQARIDEFRSFENELGDLEALAEMLSEADDAELQAEFYDRAKRLEADMASKRIYVLLDEEYDISSAVVSIHAGSGGLDSQDWCGMLCRMYMRWAESKGYGVLILDELKDQNTEKEWKLP